MRWRPRVLGSSLRLKNRESLFTRITNSMKGADDADAREHDYEDEDNEQPDRIHGFILSEAPPAPGSGRVNAIGSRPNGSVASINRISRGINGALQKHDWSAYR